jgi:uncharacterized membrane protein
VRTDVSPEIPRYLAAVEREASGLPAGRRDELIADLAEHIQVALAERPGAVTEILAELGHPRDIAATAVQEDDTVRQELQRRGNPLTLLMLWTLGILWAMAVQIASASSTSRVALAGPAVMVLGALVALWRSSWWTTRQKWTAVVASVFVPYFIVTLSQGLKSHHSTALVVLVNVLVTAFRIGGPVWLWRNRNTLAGPVRPLSPRARRVLLGLLAAVVLIVLVLVLVGTWIYLSLGSNITSVSP